MRYEVIYVLLWCSLFLTSKSSYEKEREMVDNEYNRVFQE